MELEYEYVSQGVTASDLFSLNYLQKLQICEKLGSLPVYRGQWSPTPTQA